MAEVSAAAARLLSRLDDLAADFAPHFAAAEHGARLPAAIGEPLLQEGFFRLWIPRAYGGLELPLADALRIYEAAAALDGSLGWAVMIGAGGADRGIAPGLIQQHAACGDEPLRGEAAVRPECLQITPRP